MGDSKEKPAGGIAAELYFWAQALVFALVVLVCINVFFFRLSGVDGHSMEPTFQNHDQILMQIIGFEEPRRGDIVVAMAPGWEDEPIVKRVIALAGDTVDIDTATGMVMLNGQKLDEDAYTAERVIALGTQDYPYTVPEGCVFVMGDNRNKSTDSRWVSEVGALPYERLVGRVIFRLWPLSAFGTVS